MLSIEIPAFGTVEIKNVLTDFTGTLSEDGVMTPETKESVTRVVNSGLGFVLGFVLVPAP